MISNKNIIWASLIALYVSSLFYILIMMVRNENLKVTYVLERKEYHIKVSEDNNKLLREILNELKAKREIKSGGEVSKGN